VLRITINGDLGEALASAREKLEIVDDSGRRLGMFVPEPRQREERGISTEELLIHLYKLRAKRQT